MSHARLEGHEAGSQSSSVALQILRVLGRQSDGEVLFLIAHMNTLSQRCYQPGNIPDAIWADLITVRAFKDKRVHLQWQQMLAFPLALPHVPHMAGQDGGGTR